MWHFFHLDNLSSVLTNHDYRFPFFHLTLWYTFIPHIASYLTYITKWKVPNYVCLLCIFLMIHKKRQKKTECLLTMQKIYIEKPFIVFVKKYYRQWEKVSSFLFKKTISIQISFKEFWFFSMCMGWKTKLWFMVYLCKCSQMRKRKDVQVCKENVIAELISRLIEFGWGKFDLCLVDRLNSI